MKKQKNGLIAAATRAFLDHQGLNQAAALAFYAFLSIIPLIFLIVSVAGYLAGGTGDMETLIREGLGETAPWFKDMLDERLTSLINAARTLGLQSLIFIFWASGLLFSALQTDLALPFKKPGAPMRFWRLIQPWLLGPFLSLALVCLLLFIQLLGLVSTSWLTDVLSRNIYWFSRLWAFLGLTALIFCLYLMLLPGRRAVGAASVLSLFLAAASHLLTFVFSKILAGLPNYNAVYGSLAGVVLFLLWIDYNMALILWGGHFLRLYEKRAPKQGKVERAMEEFARPEPPKQFFEEDGS